MKISEQQLLSISELRQKGLGYRAIASATGLTRDVVRYHCKANAPNSEAPASSLCPNCGKPIVQPPTGRKKRFCSDACRRSWWQAHSIAVPLQTCAHYGKAFKACGSSKRRYCSRACYFQHRFSAPS